MTGRLKYFARVEAGQAPPSSDVEDLADGLPFLQGNAEFREVSPLPRLQCDTASKVAKRDDVLLSVRAPVGALNIADREYGIGRGLCAVTATGCDYRFLWWWFHSIGKSLDAVSTGTTYQAVTGEDVGMLLFPRVPLEEQRRIADFLDAETARIDKLVVLSGRHLNLLRQRKQAVIDAMVENSGSGSKKLFYGLTLLRDGTHQPPTRVDQGVPLLTARNVSGGVLSLTEYDTHVSEMDADFLDRSFRIKPGDVLLSVKGTVGVSVLVPPGFPRSVLDRNLAILRPAPWVSGGWLSLVLNSTWLQDQMRISVFAAAQPGLPLGVIRGLRIPDTRRCEQGREVAEVQGERLRIQGVIEAVEARQRLLSERRQALITAAVTGEFDVSAASGRGIEE